MYKYLRDDIKSLQPYTVNDVEYDIKLDANEGIDWLVNLNRYPDDSSKKLREKLAQTLGKDSDELVIGNGSSELIAYSMNAYLDVGEVVVSISPSFSMYEIYTIINKGSYEKYPLTNMSELDIEGFIEFARKKKAKLVVLSNPNNPTGSVISREDIRKIVGSLDAMVILDEAYIEFSDLGMEDDTREFENLIVLRTFSKAMGLAGLRLGYMIAHKDTIECINRIRSPYNVNTLSQNTGIKALESMDLIRGNIELIRSERARMKLYLEEKGYRPIPSQGNFLFFYGGGDLGRKLAHKGVAIRGFGGELEGYYRLTIGSLEENEGFIKALEEVKNETGQDS
ncbi:MAG: histidinol-phosphate transaminase [Tissierellaceae bacterium]